MRPHRARGAGFNLIELLVVITILGMLTALLFPVLVRSRQRANVAACLSNLRQIGVAVHAYQNDNDGEVPPINPYSPHFGPETTNPDGTIRDPLHPYGTTRFLYHCPQSHYDPRPPAAEAGSYCTRFVFYLQPIRREQDDSLYLWRLQPEPDSVILYCPAAVPGVVNCQDNAVLYPPDGLFHALRGDGAVTCVRPAQVRYRNWDWDSFAGRYDVPVGDAFGPYGQFPGEPWPPHLVAQGKE